MTCLSPWQRPHHPKKLRRDWPMTSSLMSLRQTPPPPLHGRSRTRTSRRPEVSFTTAFVFVISSPCSARPPSSSANAAFRRSSDGPPGTPKSECRNNMDATTNVCWTVFSMSFYCTSTLKILLALQILLINIFPNESRSLYMDSKNRYNLIPYYR